MIMHQTFAVLKTDKPETPKLQKNSLKMPKPEPFNRGNRLNHSLCSISETIFLAMNRYSWGISQAIFWFQNFWPGLAWF